MVFEHDRRTHLAPLAAAIALLSTGSAGARALADIAMPAGSAGSGTGVAALFRMLDSRRPPRAPASPAAVTSVTSCADDGNPGTLRMTIAAANSGDTVDMSTLSCSAITLVQGAIPVFVDDLTLVGPGADKLAIDGAGIDRVLVHYGSYTLRVQALNVRNGFNQVGGYHVAGGACLVSNGYVTLDHSTVTGCRAIGEGAYGGAILSRGVTMYASTLADNLAQGSLLDTLTAAYGAGAFAYRGIVSLYDSTVSGNRATIDPSNIHGSYDTGAGIFSDNGGTAVRSTFANNFTDGTGGGLATHGPFSLDNCTISSNVARRGGGVFLRAHTLVSWHSDTIAFNRAADGGGVFFAGLAPPVELQSTLVANNSASSGTADFGATSPLVVSGANNLVVASSATVTLPADTLQVDPLLLPLADNGGPTRTHALAAGSPARDAGNDVASLGTDQRGPGYPRVVGVAADIGAFEASLAPLLSAAVPTTSSWLLGLLAGALAWLARRRLA
jgi:hypothetical protein